MTKPMTHPSEEQLVLYHFGDADDPVALGEHLAACDECSASYAAITRVLATVEAMPVPVRNESYGTHVWQRIAPRLDEPQGFDWRIWLQPRRLALVGAMAVMLIAAFLAGRIWQPEQQDILVDNSEVRGRVLAAAVGDHLEQSKMMLLDLENAPAGKPDISFERQRAEDLVEANRLYRMTAEQAGNAPVADLLEELEMTLVEIARSPEELNKQELETLRKRVEGIIFKIRVVGSQMREMEKQAPQPAPATPTRRRS